MNLGDHGEYAMGRLSYLLPFSDIIESDAGKQRLNFNFKSVRGRNAGSCDLDCRRFSETAWICTLVKTAHGFQKYSENVIA